MHLFGTLAFTYVATCTISFTEINLIQYEVVFTVTEMICIFSTLFNTKLLNLRLKPQKEDRRNLKNKQMLKTSQ